MRDHANAADWPRAVVNPNVFEHPSNERIATERRKCQSLIIASCSIALSAHSETSLRVPFFPGATLFGFTFRPRNFAGIFARANRDGQYKIAKKERLSTPAETSRLVTDTGSRRQGLAAPKFGRQLVIRVHRLLEAR
jgi:hypothetical protein